MSAVIESVLDKLDTLAGDLQGPGSDTIMVLKGVQTGPARRPPRISRSTPPGARILEVIDPVERLNRVHRLLELQLQRRQRRTESSKRRSQMSRNHEILPASRCGGKLGDSDEDDPIKSCVTASTCSSSPRRRSPRCSSSSAGSKGSTRRAPKRRTFARTSTGSATYRGTRPLRTSWTSKRRSHPRLGSLRAQRRQRAHPRVPQRPSENPNSRGRFCASWGHRRRQNLDRQVRRSSLGPAL